MSATTTAFVEPRTRSRTIPVEIVVCLIVFAAFCVAVLTRTAQMLEPDDYAYRASIVALTHGHILLTNAQHAALDRQLAAGGGQGILQWHHLASGMWVSEKNPGYPFFAVVFHLLGMLRVTPLFWGALACAGLFVGARRWLGRWAGVWAVVLYCSSGAALVFAWRATMPSFTDASLIAAGTGCLLCAMVATDAPERRRLLLGLLGFLAIDGAVFIRYTNVVELIVAAAAIVVARRSARLSWRTVSAWLASIALFGAGVLVFNQLVYGAATATGYSAGEITFSTSALLPNLEHMPGQLLRAMPMLLLGLAAAVWIAVRLLRTRGSHDPGARSAGRRDALVAVALVAGWLGLWALYASYTWTAQMSGQGASQTVHVIRFYVPVIGLIALLGAWLLAHLPRRLPPVALAVIVVLGVLSFQSMAGQGMGGRFGAGPGGAPGGGVPGGSAPGLQQAPPGGAQGGAAPSGATSGG